MINRAFCLYDRAVLIKFKGDHSIGPYTAGTDDDAGPPISDQGSSLPVRGQGTGHV